jgi:hypothetical protein
MGSSASEAVTTTRSALSAAAPVWIALGELPSDGADKSPDTAALLENGVAGNLLGGVGSGLTHVSGQTFLSLPDRGPNAVEYNSDIDDTTSYVPRFQTLRLRLEKAAEGSALPYMLETTLRKTTLLWSRQPLAYAADGAPAINDRRHYYFSGRSDNFDPAEPSTSARNGRLDPEGIRVSNDGEHVYVSDEYCPYVYEFDRSSGRRERVFELPSEFAVRHSSAQSDAEIAGNTKGRVANKGMEGLAITPDGRTLVGAMQSPLLQDGGTDARFLRIVTLSLGDGAIEQYAYELTNTGSAEEPKYPAIGEILALSDHEFLVDERDSKGFGDDSKPASSRCSVSTSTERPRSAVCSAKPSSQAKRSRRRYF